MQQNLRGSNAKAYGNILICIATTNIQRIRVPVTRCNATEMLRDLFFYLNELQVHRLL